MDFIEEFIDFLIGASEQTRQHVDSVIKEAISCSVKVFTWALEKLKIYYPFLSYIRILGRSFISKYNLRGILD